MKLIKTTYHRNGGGQSFKVFKVFEEDSTIEPTIFLVIVPTDGNPDEIYVINPLNPDGEYRGDYFRERLVELRALK